MSKKPTSAAPYRASVTAPAVTKTAPAAAEPVIAETAPTPVEVAPEPVAVAPPAAAPVIETVAPAPVAETPVAETLVAETFVVPAEVAAEPVVVTAPISTPAVTAPVIFPPAMLALPTLTEGLKTMLNSKIDFVAVGKDNLEAITASSKIWAAGVQELNKQFAESAKASLEESVAAFKALSSVKSVKEAIELQTAYSKSAVTKAMAETTKLTEASRKLTEEALAPITARISVAVGSLSKAA